MLNIGHGKDLIQSPNKINVLKLLVSTVLPESNVKDNLNSIRLFIGEVKLIY